MASCAFVYFILGYICKDFTGPYYPAYFTTRKCTGSYGISSPGCIFTACFLSLMYWRPHFFVRSQATTRYFLLLLMLPAVQALDGMTCTLLNTIFTCLLLLEEFSVYIYNIEDATNCSYYYYAGRSLTQGS